MLVQIKKLKDTAVLPSRAFGSAGHDLYAADTVRVPSMGIAKVPLGLATSFPSDYVALIWDRSSMGTKGIHCFAGVIDHNYRGEWQVVLYNSTGSTFDVHAGDRVAQVLFQHLPETDFEVVNELTASERGQGGFGSSGK